MTYTGGNLMEIHLLQVWNERDAAKRQTVIESIYTEDSTFFEGNESTTGREAINRKISSTLATLPGDFVFRLIKPVMFNHNVGKLLWAVGPPDSPVVGTGTDIALFKDGRIQSLYVFLD